MDFSHNLNLPFLLPNQAQKHVTVNESLLALDALLHLKVLSRTETSPPASPDEGDTYIPAAGASDIWSGKEDTIAIIQDNSWTFYAPNAGWTAWCEAEEATLFFDGSTWSPLSNAIGIPAVFGVNSAADPTNRLLVKSDAILFDTETGDQRVKANKSLETDTASFLFQSGFSGHAEFGLIGDNNFSIKVSPDGSTFETALTARAADGYVGVGTDTPASRLHITQDMDARLTIDTLGSGSGGGFDILNSTDGQNWRVTGSPSKFKIRDHTSALDKFEILPGASGNINFRNFGSVGVGTAAPTTTLHVVGPVRVGQFSIATLPLASSTGAGTIAYVSDASGGSILAFSDGVNWRRSDTRAVIS